MKKYDLIIWDLDGTIIDPAEGILGSVTYALQKMGFEEREYEYLKQFIGPPLYQSFQELIGMDAEQAEKAVSYYRENFSGNGGIYRNRLYEGISDLIMGIHAGRRKQIIVTSKPTVYASRIVKSHGLEDYFSGIVGSNLDGTMSSKSELISYSLGRFARHNRIGIVSIGDRKYEIEAAKESGIDSIGVLYGYGTSEEIRSSSPTYVANNVAGIRKIVMN